VSPRMTGLRTWSRPGTSRRVCGLRLDGDKEPLIGTGQKPFQQALVPGRRKTYEPILSATDTLDFELLSGLDVVLLTDLRGDDDLAFCGDGHPHGGKISSYPCCPQGRGPKARRTHESSGPRGREILAQGFGRRPMCARHGRRTGGVSPLGALTKGTSHRGDKGFSARRVWWKS